MRPTPGALPTVLARRWAATDRLVQLSLPRDRFALTPGATLNLWLGERTQYRWAAFVEDRFVRPDAATLGEVYSGWTTPAPGVATLALVSQAATPATVGPEHVAVRVGTPLTDAAQWAELTIAALTSPAVGGYASVGVLLRAAGASGSGDAYVIVAVRAAAVGAVRVGKFVAGVPAWLAETPVPWTAGDRLRAEVDGARVRVYRQDVLLLEHVDANPILGAGFVGLAAKRTLASDVAAIAEWAAGPRQEYVGLVCDLGDVSAALAPIEPTATPARWDFSVSNLQPIGGAERIAALIRHGRRDQGAFDVTGSPVRMSTAYRGASVPLVTARGRIEHITGLDESQVRFTCGGRDSLLEPRIDGKQVTYLPSPPPFGGPPALPVDPCAPSPPPSIDPGTAPAPPPEDALPDDDDAGPESPPVATPPPPPPSPGGGALAGSWVIRLTMRPGDTGIEPPEPTWVTKTEIAQLPDVTLWPPECFLFVTPGTAIDSITQLGFFATGWTNIAGMFHAHLPQGITPPAGSGPAGEWRVMYMYYRGPDVPGSVLGPMNAVLMDCLGLAGNDREDRVVGYGGVVRFGAIPLFTSVSAVGRLARFDATGIKTQADLLALRLATPPEGGDYEAALPARIETLVTWSGGGTSGGGSNVTWAVDPLASGDTVPLNQFAGPSLIGVELVSYVGTGLSNESIDVRLRIANGHGLTANPPSIST